MTRIELASLIERLVRGLYITPNEHAMLVALACVFTGARCQRATDFGLEDDPAVRTVREEVLLRSMRDVGYTFDDDDRFDDLLRAAGYERADTIAARWMVAPWRRA